MDGQNKKKWKVKFTKELLDNYKDLPDNVAEEFEKLVKGFKGGTIDPTKIGTPIDWVDLKIKLKCPGCKSNNVEWLLDKNTSEVTFHCLDCSKSFWMTKNEYEIRVRKNPDCLIN